MYRSSRSDVFCKKGVLRDFGKFTGKHMFFYRTPPVVASVCISQKSDSQRKTSAFLKLLVNAY